MLSLVMAVGGAWGVWYFARQLYTAALHGYVLTGIPEARVYRDDNRALFRNNVVAAIAIFPLVTAGWVLFLMGAFEFLRQRF